MMLCSKCTHESYCDMAQFGQQEPPITACYCFKAKRQTNGDRLRAKSDEELAKWLNDRQAKTWYYGTWSRDAWLDWLRQEVDDDE